MYRIDVSPFCLHVLKLRALLHADILNLCDVAFTLQKSWHTWKKCRHESKNCFLVICVVWWKDRTKICWGTVQVINMRRFSLVLFKRHSVIHTFLFGLLDPWIWKLSFPSKSWLIYCNDAAYPSRTEPSTTTPRGAKDTPRYSYSRLFSCWWE